MNRILNVGYLYVHSRAKNNPALEAICKQSVRKTIKTFIILTCVLMTSSNALIFGSIRAFLLDGIWETPLGYHSPFENLSDALYYADLAIQGFISIVAGLSALGIELGQVVVVDAVEALMAVSVMNLRLLGGQLETGDVFDHMKTAHLRNICVQIQDFNRYETIRVDLEYFLMKSVFNSVCFWYFFSPEFQIHHEFHANVLLPIAIRTRCIGILNSSRHFLST